MVQILKIKPSLTAAMLKDLPETQGKVEYIDVNPSSPYIKTDRITVQPKSNKNNKSKPDTSQSDKTDTSKQNDNTYKIRIFSTLNRFRTILYQHGYTRPLNIS